jgi:Na+-translocating ferredoxin:NAD+ oxidoreductase RnfD subunit
MPFLNRFRDREATLTPGPPWLGPILHRTQLDLQWLAVAAAMTAAGIVFFGWRGIAGVCWVALASSATYFLVSLLLLLLSPRRPADSSLHALVLGLLLGLILPPSTVASVPILAGVLLGVIMPFVGRAHRVRLHPVALALVAAWVLPAFFAQRDLRSLEGAPPSSIQAVLRPNRVVVGDLRERTEVNAVEPWWLLNDSVLSDAVHRFDPGVQMLKERKRMLQFESLMLKMLQSGELCRMEEILLGSVPGSAGGSSRGLLIVLGVYLMYRRLGTWKVPLVALLAAIATLMVMPLTTSASGGEHLTIVAARLAALPPRVAITYVSYFILASPLTVIVLILAPMTAPMSGAGRVLYGVVLGAMTVATLWAFASPQAGFISLIVASLLSHPLDGMKHSPFAGPGASSDKPRP